MLHQIIIIYIKIRLSFLKQNYFFLFLTIHHIYIILILIHFYFNNPLISFFLLRIKSICHSYKLPLLF